MGNAIAEPKKKPLTIHDLNVKVSEYKTIIEGDPEMKEDPEFPLEMMHEAMNKNNTIEGNAVKGTYVYYPNKNKPKMWIGNYKILNPEDILCKDVAAKIGMSEAQWKKYVENKKNGNNTFNNYDDLDYLNEEQKETLKNILKNSAYDNVHDINNKENGYNESQFNPKLYDGQAYGDNNYGDQNTLQAYDTNEKGNYLKNKYDELNNVMKKDFIDYNQNIYNVDDFRNENGEYDHNEYINKLNEEAERVRKLQEQEIYKQKRELMYYGNSDVAYNSQIETSANPIIYRNEIPPMEFLNEGEFEYVEEDEFMKLDENMNIISLHDYNKEQQEIEESQKNENEEESEKEKECEKEKESEKKKEEKKKVEPLRKPNPKKNITSTVDTKPQKKEAKKETELQSKLKVKPKKETIKAKVNSFLKKGSATNKPEIVSRKFPNLSHNKPLASTSIKSTGGLVNLKTVTTDKNKNVKNAKLKKNVVE